MTAPVRWGILSTAHINEKLLAGAALSEQVDVVAVGSRDLGRAKAFAQRHGIPVAHGSYEELLADPAVEAIYNPLPNALHCEWSIRALEAGKHVLCEKPLAVTLADAIAMEDACELAGVVLGIDHHLRAAPTIAAMRRLLVEGAIGEIVAARVFHARALPEELQTWRLESPGAGAGVVLDITVHDVDAIRFLTGDEVAEVTAATANQGLAAGPVEDSAMGVLRMRGGQLVSFHDAYTVAHAGTGIELHGKTGSLIGRDLLMPDPVGEVLLRRGEAVERIEVGERRPIYEVVVERFAAAARGEGEPVASGVDGIRSLEVALAVLQSAHEGRTVAVLEPAKGI